MDASAQAVRIRLTYGGSDQTQPSFNSHQYVRYATAGSPLDLGPLPDGDTFLDGLIGADRGSQTLFFRFRLDGDSRIGVRIVSTNPYTDQYLSLNLSDQQGGQRPSGQETFIANPLADDAYQAYSTVLTSAGYGDPGYWVDGYGLLDGLATQAVANQLQEGAELPSLPTGDPLPAGEYVIALSSSQWQSLPFRVQLGARAARSLSGAAELLLDLSGRTSRQAIAGAADLKLDALGRTANHFKAFGIASLRLSPTADPVRVSPFQG